MTKRRHRGRPPVPDAEKRVRLQISLSPEQAAWLRERPDGISRTIQDFIRAAMRRQRLMNENGISK